MGSVERVARRQSRRWTSLDFDGPAAGGYRVVQDIDAGALRFTVVGPGGEKLYSISDPWAAEAEARELAAAAQTDEATAR